MMSFVALSSRSMDDLPPRPQNISDRRRISSTATSLLDDEEEEKLGPGLRYDSDDESQDSKRLHRETMLSPTLKPMSMDFIAEGMTNLLCPTSLEDSGHFPPPRSSAHNRVASETEFIQNNVSNGTCGGCAAARNTIQDQLGGSQASLSTMVDDSAQNNNQMMIGCTDMTLEDLRMRVEADLSAVLGSTGAAAQWVADLNTWLLGMNDRSRKTAVPSRKVFRNRCGVRTAQAQRLQRLWHNWHSDTGESMGVKASSPDTTGAGLASTAAIATDEVENPNMPPLPIWSISVTRSLDDAEWAAPLLATPSTPGPKELKKSFHAHYLPSAAEADLYYDSDPEVFRQASRTLPRGSLDSPPLSPKSKPIRRRRKISIPEAIDTSASMVSREQECPPTPRNDFNKGAPSFDMPPSFDNHVELSEEETVHEFIKELTFKKTTLVWHPSPERTTSNSKSSSPISVEAWFELGSRLPTTLIQPKFMWRETYQPDLLNRKRLGTTYRKPSSLDLLTMIRIVKPSTLDRSAYPFAKLDKTFTVLTHTNKLYVFEAVSSKERDWLVHGLKLAVARLASMIIVGDDQMFVEFFSPWAYTPPLLDGSGSDEECVQMDEEERVQEEDKRVTKGFFDSTTDHGRQALWGTNSDV